MAIKHLYTKIRTAFHFCYQHFYSLNKRLLQLIFRKDRVVTLNVKNHGEDNSVKRGGSTISLSISTNNSYLIMINGLPIPVLNDRHPIKIHWPVDKGKSKLTICAKGIGNRKRCSFVIENNQPSIAPIPFNKQLLVKEPNRRVPAMTVRLKEPTIQKTAIPSIKLKLPALKRTAFSLNQSLEEDLLNFLANNQKEHE
ncbi:MAG: hypothetical protein A3D31_10105 [Candidatus Fluviicola riflensis]|nr:MAG: hypothetical protein CHH17_14525 [Candidatus Fluviicola riflensis]OGS77357.1 MAG: hypothetical protein A3D31_10105 [Candidatus Fluviicola riflensis]OGS83937.1 MAG: hypothetical protein A3E30_11505 [Fluviicola sp. RIFCSPHIGHO2_12_FULL_43_24]OGS84424.1 MAG: hypothetical protein A2724_07045 [Fluviicola sp. RIFCSPHIGHO2_01_FULL_43_53]